jgi:hypothetical protein
MHWDGKSWSVASPPEPSGAAASLSSVAAVSASDVWAAGSAGCATLTVHWGGGRWSVVPSPSVDGASNALGGIAAVARDDVWAVGTSRTQATSGGSTTYYTFRTLALHWDGVRWATVPAANGADASTACCTSIVNELVDVAGAVADDVWAVGLYSGDGGSRTLIERYTIP